MIIEDVKQLQTVNAYIEKCENAKKCIGEFLKDDMTEIKINTVEQKARFSELLSPTQMEELLTTVLTFIETNQENSSQYLESIKLPSLPTIIDSIINKTATKPQIKPEKAKVETAGEPEEKSA
ncbi:hypothetical protein [Acetobacterium sp.]|uniref:hypothetical protein n=1 Tax=Acetobacterium sp. TaxID=1872094 RepID=UPI002717E40E|nr:hypothetical protein [Acetobacterium sp.]MDO9492652.1 hypothetical protein [Acetobacterium sp.]